MLGLPVLAGDRIAEGGLDLAGQVVAGRRERIVHAFEDGERLAVLQGLDDLACREWAETRRRVRQPAAMPLHAQVIDGRLGRLHVAAHADEDVLGVLAAVGFDEVVAAAGLAVEHRRRHSSRAGSTRS